MICENCKKDRKETDFIKNQKFCYQCEFQKKTLNAPKKKTKKRCYCRICGQEFFNIENLKKRQRTVFCSWECAEIGHKQISSNYWTRKVKNIGVDCGFYIAH